MIFILVPIDFNGFLIWFTLELLRLANMNALIKKICVKLVVFNMGF